MYPTKVNQLHPDFGAPFRTSWDFIDSTIADSLQHFSGRTGHAVNRGFPRSNSWLIDPIGLMMPFGVKYNMRVVPLRVLAGHSPERGDIEEISQFVNARRSTWVSPIIRLWAESEDRRRD
jgi:hypothetical protein